MTGGGGGGYSGAGGSGMLQEELARASSQKSEYSRSLLPYRRSPLTLVWSAQAWEYAYQLENLVVWIAEVFQVGGSKVRV